MAPPAILERGSRIPASPKKGKPQSKTSKPAKSGRDRLITKETAHEIFRRFQNANPEPKGELEHSNSYTLLVAVVLSAQATDAGVNKATRALFKVADSPEKMLKIGEEKS